MTSLANAIRDELRSACAHLLDAGASPVSAASGEGGIPGPLGRLLATIDGLAATVEPALVDLSHVTHSTHLETVPSRLPRRARPTRRPWEYARHGAALVPLTWETARPAQEIDRAPLRWLAWGLDRLEQELGRALAELEETLDEVTRFREGSRFGREELANLRAREERLHGAELRLIALRSRVRVVAELQLQPSPRPPYPFPRSRSWQRIAALLRFAADPDSDLPAMLRGLLTGPIGDADLPYLYQRWCGWRLTEGLRALGFVSRRDPIPPLLLSGAIEFRRGDERLELFCEPRLVAGKDPIGGLCVHRGEATPDFVLTAAGEGGRVVYVLDPTLRVQPEARRAKARYLEQLRLTTAREVAGVRILAGPSRAWAAAPLPGTKCRVDDWRGQSGTIPMEPRAFEPAPLLAWLTDFIDEGGALGALRPPAPAPSTANQPDRASHSFGPSP